MNERFYIITYINTIFNNIRKYIRLKFIRTVVLERIVVKVERIPEIKERTIILYTDDPQHKQPHQHDKERIH